MPGPNPKIICNLKGNEGNIIRTTQIYPIGGGKGGIGKSLITANLGVLFAQQGKRVAILDLDLGASNLHTFIGQNHLEKGLDAFINKTEKQLENVVVKTEIPNLSFISSANCMIEVANLYAAQKEKIIRAIQGLDFDYVFLDLGAGTNFNMLDFFLTSGQGIFVLTSEPTAIENAFNFIKAVYFRIIKRTLKQKVFSSVTRSMDLSGNTMDQSFRILKAIRKKDRQTAELLKEKLGKFQFYFMVNKLRKDDDPGLGEKIEKVCNRHFYSGFKFLGNIRYDEKVHDAVLLRKIFITRYAYTPSANDINRIAKQLEAFTGPRIEDVFYDEAT